MGPGFTGLAILDSESKAFLKDIQQQGFHLRCGEIGK